MSDTPPPEPIRCLDDFPGCRDPSKPTGTCLGLACRIPDDGDGNAACGGPECPAVNPPEDE